MFVNESTLKTIQTKLVQSSQLYENVEVKQIWQGKKKLFVKFLLNGTEAVSVVYPEPGEFIHDVICTAVRWGDYYILSEVYRGLEIDENAADILLVWPATTPSDNVVSMTKTDLETSVSRLQSRFKSVHKQ